MRTVIVYEIGDTVMDEDGGRPGRVVSIERWDEHLGCLLYRVEEFSGPTHWRNGCSLAHEPTPQRGPNRLA